MSPSAMIQCVGSRPGLAELVRAWAFGWNRHSPALVAACCTDEVRFEDPALPAPAQGRAEVARFVRELTTAFPDLRVGAAGRWRTLPTGQVLVPWRGVATCLGPLPSLGVAPTGTRIETVGVHIWELEDGLVAHHRAFYDLERMLRALGADHPALLTVQTPGSTR